MKKVFYISVVFLVTIYPSHLLSQSIEPSLGNGSCEPGGEIWVCGTSEMVQVASDIDKNCSDWVYENCQVIRTIVDVCSPDERTAQVFEGGAECIQ